MGWSYDFINHGVLESLLALHVERASTVNSRPV